MCKCTDPMTAIDFSTTIEISPSQRPVGQRLMRRNIDLNGHGTHCAGTVGGSKYGVAKRVNLVAVKVLDRLGSGTLAGVAAGIDWAAGDAKGNSVISMSLGGGFNQALNDAVAGAVSKGVTTVVAAGNDAANACNYSPASAPSAITVGATQINDQIASFSNRGSCVDILAPGVSITSSWIGSPTAINTISGTSMATPQVAGLAAYLISLEGLSTPAAVEARIVALAANGALINLPAGTVNRLSQNDVSA